jgi:rare lipoprotein A
MPEPAAAPAIVDNEKGIASWYGHPYHGRPAASGEIYDMEKMTAAHRTLPFETWVRVHDLDSNRQVDVRINDRGPFVDGRIIDLSRAAARQIAMIGPGTARVRLEIMKEPPAGSEVPHYAVQVGAYKEKANAEAIRHEMARKYGAARMVLREGSPSVWRVLVGFEPSQEKAQGLADQIRGGAGHRTAFVVRLDDQSSRAGDGL